MNRTDELIRLRAERDEMRDVVVGLWTTGGIRALVVWSLASAWLAGTRTRIWLIERGVIR